MLSSRDQDGVIEVIARVAVLKLFCLFARFSCSFELLRLSQDDSDTLLAKLKRLSCKIVASPMRRLLGEDIPIAGIFCEYECLAWIILMIDYPIISTYSRIHNKVIKCFFLWDGA